MATKLYVGNLSYQTNDQSLHDLFSEAGSVSSAQVVTDRDTGQSRGFGFVEMSTEAEAQAGNLRPERPQRGRPRPGRQRVPPA